MTASYGADAPAGIAGYALSSSNAFSGIIEPSSHEGDGTLSPWTVIRIRLPLEVRWIQPASEPGAAPSPLAGGAR